MTKQSSYYVQNNAQVVCRCAAVKLELNFWAIVDVSTLTSVALSISSTRHTYGSYRTVLPQFRSERFISLAGFAYLPSLSLQVSWDLGKPLCSTIGAVLMMSLFVNYSFPMRQFDRQFVTHSKIYT